VLIEERVDLLVGEDPVLLLHLWLSALQHHFVPFDELLDGVALDLGDGQLDEALGREFQGVREQIHNDLADSLTVEEELAVEEALVNVLDLRQAFLAHLDSDQVEALID